MKRLKKHKQIKSLIYVVFLFALSQIMLACSEINCMQFDYDTFHLDTNKLKQNLYFTNKKDTIEFKLKTLEVLSKTKSKPTFTTLDECINGVVGEYKSLNYTYSLYYLLDKKVYEVYFALNEFDTTILNINNKDEINLVIEDTNNSEMKKIVITNGELYSFTDYWNKFWIVVKK